MIAHRDYRFLWVGNFFANTAHWLQLLTLGWLVKSLTEGAGESALLVVGVGGMNTLPGLIVGPIGGVMGDRVDKRKLVMSIQCFMAAFAFAFAWMVRMDAVAVWHVFAYAAISGACLSGDAADATGAHRRRRPAPHAGERIRHERPHDSRNAGGRPVRGRDFGRVFGLLLELRHRVAAVRRDDSGVRPDADAVRVRAPARRRGAGRRLLERARGGIRLYLVGQPDALHDNNADGRPERDSAARDIPAADIHERDFGQGRGRGRLHAGG